MGMRLAGLLLALWIVAGPLGSGQAATPVGAVLGGSIACDPAVDTCGHFPTSASILCNGTGAILDCPQFFHPDWSQIPGSRFYGITNRTNPPRYLTSTDGATWSLVTTQPWTAAILNFGASMAVSSDGSLLSAAGQGANSCLIRKSTDQGANWSTVFTSAVQVCSLVFGFPTPPTFYCADTGGYCALINPSNPASVTVIFSTDNGSNWTIGAAYADASADSTAWGPILQSGAGIITRGVNNSAGQPFGVRSGNDFIATANYVPVPAVNRNCRPYIQNTTKRAMCVRNAGGNLFQVVDGTIPVEVGAEFSLTDAFTGTGNEPMVLGFLSSFGYLLNPSASVNTRLNVYLSTSAFAGGASLIAQLSHASALLAGCCRGNFLAWGSKIYFTNGATASNAFFGVIQ